MKAILVLAILLMAQMSFADCAWVQPGWSGVLKGTGFGGCREYNMSQNSCIKKPVQEDAEKMAEESLMGVIIFCKNICEYRQATFTTMPQTKPTCEYVRSAMNSALDYYSCTLSVEASCNY